MWTWGDHKRRWCRRHGCHCLLFFEKTRIEKGWDLNYWKYSRNSTYEIIVSFLRWILLVQSSTLFFFSIHHRHYYTNSLLPILHPKRYTKCRQTYLSSLVIQRITIFLDLRLSCWRSIHNERTNHNVHNIIFLRSFDRNNSYVFPDTAVPTSFPYVILKNIPIPNTKEKSICFLCRQKDTEEKEEQVCKIFKGGQSRKRSFWNTFGRV